MKGRNRNSSEKRYHDLLCSVVGCIACRKTGDFTNYVSVHHIDGRTKPNAHWLVIPLCAHHHQDLGFSSDFIPVHPFKTRFEEAYGKQSDLARECVELLLAGGFDVPAKALEVVGIKKRMPDIGSSRFGRGSQCIGGMSMGSVVQNMKIEQIRTDGGTQPRTELNESVVDEYSQAITDGAKLPAVTVFHDGSSYWLADGFHRFFAHKKIDARDIPVELHQGTQRDAILYSVGANAAHGLRRSNEDKRKAVVTLLDDPEWSKWSDREIARQCGVSHPFVAALRTPFVADRQQANRNASNARKVESDSTPQPTAQIKKQSRVIESRPADIPPADNTDEINEARFAISELSEENDTLRDRLAVAAMDASDEERLQAHTTIQELRSRVKALEVELDAVKSMRDQYMIESAEKSKQIAYWRKRAEKVAA